MENAPPEKAETHVISALRIKRAEIDGDIRQAEKRAVQLRADLQALDHAMRIFDPTISPATIRPIAKRQPAAPGAVRHGQFSRLVLDALRRADKPLTCRAVAECIASESGMDITSAEAMNSLVHKVRNTLLRNRHNLTASPAPESTGQIWSVGLDRPNRLRVVSEGRVRLEHRRRLVRRIIRAPDT
jgi:hypothetical protein